jgi:glycosyltransferase involved in cell wall biosynthesis
MSLRIAMICSQVPPVYGGAGTQALSLARELAKRGCEVEILTQNQCNVSRVERRDGIVIRRAPGESLARALPRRAAEVVRTLTFSAWLTWRLSRRRYSVYHAHGNYWFGLVPALFSRFRHVPLLVKITRLGEDDARTVFSKRLGPLRVGSLYGLPMRTAAAVISLNEEIEARHIELLPEVPVVRFPNGADTQALVYSPEMRADGRARIGIASEDLVYLFVGYLAPHKGVRELLEAWDGLQKPVGPRCWLILVGPSGGFYRELDPKASELAHPDGREGVIALDHLPATAMAEMYSVADIFVLPTHAEGMPNSLLEALAAGLPSVVTLVPGVKEVVDGVEGVVGIEHLDASELREALGRAAGLVGSRTSKLPERLSLSQVVNMYLGLYETILRSRNTGVTVAANESSVS